MSVSCQLDECCAYVVLVLYDERLLQNLTGRLCFTFISIPPNKLTINNALVVEWNLLVPIFFQHLGINTRLQAYHHYWDICEIKNFFLFGRSGGFLNHKSEQLLAYQEECEKGTHKFQKVSKTTKIMKPCEAHSDLTLGVWGVRVAMHLIKSRVRWKPGALIKYSCNQHCQHWNSWSTNFMNWVSTNINNIIDRLICSFCDTNDKIRIRLIWNSIHCRSKDRKFYSLSKKQGIVSSSLVCCKFYLLMIV